MQCVGSIQVSIRVQKKERRKQRGQTKGCTASKEREGKEESTGSDTHEIKMHQSRKAAARILGLQVHFCPDSPA